MSRRFTRITDWLGLTREAAPTEILPPPRNATPMTDRRAITVGAVYRALQVLITSAAQLTIDVTTPAGVPASRPPSIIRKPSLDLRFDEWLTYVVLDLATDGNVYLHKVTGPAGEVLDLRILPAAETVPGKDQNKQLVYRHAGDEYQARDILHLSLIRRAGWDKGVGPLEAARRGLTFAAGAADYAAGWFTSTGQPSGVLTSDQALNPAQALQYRNQWNGLDENGNQIIWTDNPSGIKVLGKGLTYTPTLLKPADVLWLEAQNFNTVDVARIYGVPASLMLIGIEGASTTYANVAQEWLAFVRFTLMSYLRPIESALTALIRGDVRFNLDALLRGDTLTRYQAHALAIDSGWLTIDEVRAIEGLEPTHHTLENTNA